MRNAPVFLVKVTVSSTLDWASSMDQWSLRGVNFFKDYILNSLCFSDSVEWQKFFLQETLEVERFWIVSKSHATSYKTRTHPSCVNIILVLADWFVENICLPNIYLFFGFGSLLAVVSISIFLMLLRAQENFAAICWEILLTIAVELCSVFA